MWIMEDTDFAIIKKIVAVLLIGFIAFVVITANLRNLLDTCHGPSYESEAIGNLRTVVGAQNAFKHAEGGYASTWKELRDEPIADGKPAYLDIDLSVVIRGYAYTLKPAGKSLVGTNGTTVYTDFICTAIPVKYKRESKRSFYVDSTGVIRFEYGKPATIGSAPI
jgi:hypothetical protein